MKTSYVVVTPDGMVANEHFFDKKEEAHKYLEILKVLFSKKREVT